MAAAATVVLQNAKKTLSNVKPKQARRADNLAAHAPIVPLTKLAHTWYHQDGWRGFILFLLAAGSWVMLQHVRVDWQYGYNTYQVYQLAEASLPFPYRQVSEIGQLTHFIQSDLLLVMDEMASTDAVCPDCSVGLTPRAGDMENLGLEEFICSDFDSVVGSSNYPRRDCATQNEVWAAAPSVNSAPCCHNNTLARLSLVLMVLHDTGGPENMTYEELVTSPAYTQLVGLASGAQSADDPEQDNSFRTWVQYQVLGEAKGGLGFNGHLLQVIVSRAGRMAGVGFKAAFIDEEWFPAVVKCWQEIWSQRYSDTAAGKALRFLFLFFTIFSTLHELLDMFFYWKHKRERPVNGRTSSAEELGVNGRQRLLYLWWKQKSREYGGIFHSGSTLFILFIEIPSIVLPFTLEALRSSGYFSIIDYNLTVAYTLAILLARFFQEGQVMPAFQLLVLTMSRAAEQLVNFLCIMAITLLVATEMHVTIFGVYTSSYENSGEAFLQMFNHFANGVDFDNKGDIMNSRIGYVFLYLFNTLVLLLVLSQFFIAILVAAWDSAADVKNSLEEKRALPPGFTPRRDVRRPLWRAALSFTVLWLTGYSLEARAFSQQVTQALRSALAQHELLIRKRKERADDTYASESDQLTEEEENMHYLFEQGMLDVNMAFSTLESHGLSSYTAGYVLSAYRAPERVLKDLGVDANASDESATTSGTEEAKPRQLKRNATESIVGILTKRCPSQKSERSLPSCSEASEKAPATAAAADAVPKLTEQVERLRAAVDGQAADMSRQAADMSGLRSAVEELVAQQKLLLDKPNGAPHGITRSKSHRVRRTHSSEDGATGRSSTPEGTSAGRVAVRRVPSSSSAATAPVAMTVTEANAHLGVPGSPARKTLLAT